jgi:hypothetical protein
MQMMFQRLDPLGLILNIEKRKKVRLAPNNISQQSFHILLTKYKHWVLGLSKIRELHAGDDYFYLVSFKFENVIDILQ